MRVGVAEARRRFSELLDRAIEGEIIEVARRGEVVAVLTAPVVAVPSGSIVDAVRGWREVWGVAEWPDDGALDDLRDRSPGRAAPW